MSPVVAGVGWEGAKPTSRGTLISKVCGAYGFDLTDSDLTAQALNWLDEAVDDLNMAMFEFNRAAETGITMTASTAYVTPTNDNFYRESLFYLVKTSDNSHLSPLIYLPWVQFQRWLNDNTTTGIPRFYSTFNIDSDGKIYLAPMPDATTASDYTLTLEYYRRIPLISSLGEGDTLLVPREIENVLVYGAQKRAAIHVQGSGDKDVAAFEALEAKALDRLRRVDKTHPDERKQWILSDYAGRPNRIRANTDFWVRY